MIRYYVFIALFAGGFALPSLIHDVRQFKSTAAQATLSTETAIHFSPTENLETVDIPLIDQAQKSIDIAMYTFTDTRIADALVDAAKRGVSVRVYRDREQFEAEQRRGGRVMAVLSTTPGIHVRVKGSDELMHDKAFVVDRRMLRSGSGNWSLSAAKYQDNEITFTTEPSECADFESAFDAMWNRSDNEAVQ